MSVPELTAERCEECGLFSRQWIEFVRSIPRPPGTTRFEDHCRCRSVGYWKRRAEAAESPIQEGDGR